MESKRGTKDMRDVGRTKRLSARELGGITVPPTALHLLALWLFLSRHADSRAHVIVCGGCHDDHEGDRGRK